MGPCVSNSRNENYRAPPPVFRSYGHDPSRSKAGDYATARNVNPGLPEIRPSNVQIKLVRADLNISSNKRRHHCDEYDLSNLIVRRGDWFVITLSFNQDVTKLDGNIFLQFTTGSRPDASNGTKIRLSLQSSGYHNNEGRWTVVVKPGNEPGSKKMRVKVKSDPSALVGIYEVAVEITDENQKKILTNIGDVYVLFNPWNEDDTVFMEDEQERSEYVLNEDGIIWIGSASNMGTRPWYFGQFEAPCLPFAVNLLNAGNLAAEARGDPIQVTRLLSALINSNDDNGVLWGKWEEPYTDGVKPWVWNGSVPILEKYRQTKLPVRYGQCWVFSAITT